MLLCLASFTLHTVVPGSYSFFYAVLLCEYNLIYLSILRFYGLWGGFKFKVIMNKVRLEILAQVFFKFKLFYSEIIVNPHAAIRNDTETPGVPFTQIPSEITSRRTLGH